MSETKGLPGRAEKRRRRWWVLPLILVALLVLVDLRAHGIPFLDYLGVILTWPVVVGILVVVLLFRHHDSVDYWIRHLRLQKGGDLSLGPMPLQKEIEEAADEAAAVTTTKTGEEKEEPSLKERQTYLFLMLSVRFPRRTKALLAFVATSNAGRSVSQVVEVSPDSGVEEPIEMLKSMRLVEVEDGWLRVTPLGYEFLDFLARRGV